ncbi:MAG: nitroreductase family protein [Lachnospiraceae bacterium]|nr:nitroreductase family protein [Lachnospiraceae bacterium]
MDAIFERISVRIFDSREVEPDKIESILRAGMAAPSGGNQRPWEFYVVKDAEMITKLAGSSPYAVCAGGAGVVIVPCYRTGGMMYPELVHMDMSACVENMLIEITALGLGGVWLSIAPYEDRMRNVDRILGIGDKLRTFALIPVGYPAQSRPATDRFEESRVHGPL